VNKEYLINHNNFGDIMIYFFLKIFISLILISLMLLYFKSKMNIISFVIILFNINTSFFFIFLNYDTIYLLFTILLSIIIYNFIVLFNKKDNEIVLIKDGNINFHEVIENYSLTRLISYLKIRNIRLDEVAYCIKNNNRLTVIKNKNIGYPISIILDGMIMENNLKLINKSRKWLTEELLNNHLLIKNIEYAYYKKNKIYFISN